jgi:hypothetical protein
MSAVVTSRSARRLVRRAQPFSWPTLTVEGEENLTWYQEEGKLPMGGFCKSCGSSLLQHREDGTHALVFGGAIDTKDMFKIDFLLCVDARICMYV